MVAVIFISPSSQPLPAIIFIHATAGKIHSRLDKGRFLGRAGTISLLTFTKCGQGQR